MERNEAYLHLEKEIRDALRTEAKELIFEGYQWTEKLTELPESVGQLTRIQSLNLSGNQLTVLPESLCQLTQLQSLNLANNELTVLPESLGHLTQLQSITLYNNKLEALPESLGQLTQLQSLSLANNKLTALPESLSRLTQLQSLNLENNKLTALPESLGRLTQLQSLNLGNNQLKTLPQSLAKLTQLQSLIVSDNQLREVPESLSQMTLLELLEISRNPLAAFPEWLGQLTCLTSLKIAGLGLTALPKWLIRLPQLQSLVLSGNQLAAVPGWLSQLTNLQSLDLQDNRLASVPNFLLEFPQLKILRLSKNKITDLPDNPKCLAPLTVFNMMENRLKKLPAWVGKLEWLEQMWLDNGLISDLPTELANLAHLRDLDLRGNPLGPELSAAFREGLDAVKRYLRRKAEPQVALNEAKLIFIGEGEVGKSCLLGALRGDPWEEGRSTTHGIEIKPVNVTAANGREITLNGWDFGGQRVYRPTHQFFFSAPAVYLVMWKPREGPQQGFVKDWISLVKHREPDAKILVVATHGGPGARQPDIDRQEIWDLFGKETVIDFFHIDSKSGEGIPALKEAIASVAASLPEVGRSVAKSWHEARLALKGLGCAYVTAQRAIEICADHKLGEEDAKLFLTIEHRLGHLIHYTHDPLLKDIVILKPDWLATAISYVLDDKATRDAHGLVSHKQLTQLWNDSTQKHQYAAELHPVFIKLMERYDLCYRVAEGKGDSPDGTRLIAQLVPDVKPSPIHGWVSGVPKGETERVQICRIVEDKNGQSAGAEGLFYQLIVRLHKYSMGRVRFADSSHWQRGLVLDDNYNGRALLEHVGNDVKITVRAVYPEAFLSVLTHEVKWLVESFWKGLRCEVVVPCMEPCGKKAPGTGVFEVQKLIAFKRQGVNDFPCLVSGCNQLQDIDCLLRNSPAVTRELAADVLEDAAVIKFQVVSIRQQLTDLQGIAVGGFAKMDANARQILSKIDDTYTQVMQTLLDEAKEGPRLFMLEPVEPGFFSLPKWIKEKFRVTLFCEHCRLPLPLLNPDGDKSGVYEFDVTSEWLATIAPYAKMIADTLSIILPMASALAKFKVSEETYRVWEKRLDAAKKAAESVSKASEKLIDSHVPEFEAGDRRFARGAELRRLHAFLKGKDPGFGGLVRVQNRRHEFLWVHPQFESEY